MLPTKRLHVKTMWQRSRTIFVSTFLFSTTAKQIGILFLIISVGTSISCDRGALKDRSVSLTIAEPLVTLSPQLLSEIRAGIESGRDTVRTKHVLQNHSSVDQVAKFKRANCFCIQVLVNHKKLKRDDIIVIPGGGTAMVELRWKVPPVTGKQTAKALFEVAKLQGASEYQSIEAAIDVEPDLTVVPNVLGHSFGSFRERTVEKKLFISRVVRADKADLTHPTIERLPAGVTITRIVAASPPFTNITSDLWRMTFEVTLKIELDEWSTVMSGQPIHIVFFGPSNRVVSSMSIPVLVKRVFGIEAPSELHFGILQPGELRSRRVAISASDERRFTIRKIISSTPEISASLATSQPDKRHWIDVRCTLRSAPCAGKIVIETDHPEAPQITIEADAFPSEETAKSNQPIKRERGS